MDTRTVRQPSVENRVFLIDLATNPLSDVMHGRQQCVFGFEPSLCLVQLARSLDVNLIKSIDHDLSHTVIVKQLSNWAEKVANARLEDCFSCHRLYDRSLSC